MVIEALTGALLIAVGCNVYLFACWFRERLRRELVELQRDRAVRQAREGLAAMGAAIRANEETLRNAPRP